MQSDMNFYFGMEFEKFLCIFASSKSTTILFYCQDVLMGRRYSFGNNHFILYNYFVKIQHRIKLTTNQKQKIISESS